MLHVEGGQGLIEAAVALFKMFKDDRPDAPRAREPLEGFTSY